MTEWLAHVESVDTTEGARRVLREYAKSNRRGRLMSRPRREVAAALGISERAVTKHLKRAREDGLYVVVTPGQQGRTAVYEGTFGYPKHEESLYEGTAGTFSGVPADIPAGVPAPVRSGSRGSHHYYGFDVERPEVARRRELAASFFTVIPERELVSGFSLLDREGSDAATCRGCGGPLDQASVEIGFAVGKCCEVVIESDHDAATTEEATA